MVVVVVVKVIVMVVVIDMVPVTTVVSRSETLCAVGRSHNTYYALQNVRVCGGFSGRLTSSSRREEVSETATRTPPIPAPMRSTHAHHRNVSDAHACAIGRVCVYVYTHI